MKSATVRDLRNSFARISRWLDTGETVEVTKRGRPYARITPLAPAKPRTKPKPDIIARMREDFGDYMVTDDTYAEIMTETEVDYDERIP